MSNAYKAVQWNRHKRIYDMATIGMVVLFIAAFLAITVATHPSPNDLGPPPVLLLRATAACAFIMLHIILMIGPLARLDSRFAPLLYNRRHLGVTTFAVAFVHGVVAILFYHGMGNGNPLVGIFTDNTNYGSLAQFPFQVLGFFALLIMFLMAATSHDYWLKNLGVAFWKTLHMSVYLAYGMLVMHVALGALQSETSPVYVALVAIGVVLVTGLHLVAGLRERPVEAGLRSAEDWVAVGSIEDISPDCALVVSVNGGERVAVYRHGNKISAISNVCAHQGGPLGEGKIVDDCITCPWHGYQYMAVNGQSPPPFDEKVPTYRVKLKGRQVLLDPNPLPPGTPVEPAIFDLKEEKTDV